MIIIATENTDIHMDQLLKYLFVIFYFDVFYISQHDLELDNRNSCLFDDVAGSDPLSRSENIIDVW